MREDVDVAARYYFCFISSTIIVSQKESVLCNSNPACLGAIIELERLDIYMVIGKLMAMRADYCQTSIPFIVFIKELCR